MRLRKKAGLILSGIGGTIYLLASLMLSYLLVYLGIGFLPFILTGVISLTGTGIGVKNIKRGGIIILISIPLSLVIGIIFNPYGFYIIGYLGVILFYSQPHFVFVIVGGILCLKSSDSEKERADPRILILKEKDRKSVSFYELMCGIMGILGIYFGFKRKEFARFLCLIAGILGVAGLIIPFPIIGYWYLPSGMLLIFRIIFFDYFFIILFLIGGLLSVASENRYLNYYLEKAALKNSSVNVEEEIDKFGNGGGSFDYEKK